MRPLDQVIEVVEDVEEIQVKSPRRAGPRRYPRSPKLGHYTAAIEGCCSATAVSAGPRRMIEAIESKYRLASFASGASIIRLPPAMRSLASATTRPISDAGTP